MIEERQLVTVFCKVDDFYKELAKYRKYLQYLQGHEKTYRGRV